MIPSRSVLTGPFFLQSMNVKRSHRTHSKPHNRGSGGMQQRTMPQRHITDMPWGGKHILSLAVKIWKLNSPGILFHCHIIHERRMSYDKNEN